MSGDIGGISHRARCCAKCCFSCAPSLFSPLIWGALRRLLGEVLIVRCLGGGWFCLGVYFFRCFCFCALCVLFVTVVDPWLCPLWVTWYVNLGMGMHIYLFLPIVLSVVSCCRWWIYGLHLRVFFNVSLLSVGVSAF